MNYMKHMLDNLNKALKDNNLILRVHGGGLNEVSLSNLKVLGTDTNQNAEYILNSADTDTQFLGKVSFATFETEILSANNMYYGYKQRVESLVDNLCTQVLKEFRETMLSITPVWKIDSAFFLMSKDNYVDAPVDFRRINTYDAYSNRNATRYIVRTYGGTINGSAFFSKNLFNDIALIQPVYLKPFDLTGLDHTECATDDRNKVYVVRKGINYGYFEVDQSEINEMFQRCSSSNYLLTGLANHFNERREFGGERVSQIMFATMVLCDMCGLISTSRRKVSHYNHSSVCDTCSTRLKLHDIDVNSFVAKNFKINAYGHNPNLLNFEKFTSEATPLYMGVELEVDSESLRTDDFESGEDNGDDNGDYDHDEKNLHSVMALNVLSGGKDVVYAKTDGSLSNGFEIITHPMTLAKHTKSMKWQSGMDLLSKLGYRSHNTTTCGLHVHINRSFFGSTSSVQNINAAKISYLLEKNMVDVIKFTRRKQYELSRWATFGSVYTSLNYADSTGQLLGEKTKSLLSKNFSRYYPKRNKYIALNTMHSNTYEFRIFKGTLNFGSFLATLQFVDNISRLVKDIPNTDDMFETLDKVDFNDIINYRPYAELTAYWDKRKGV